MPLTVDWGREFVYRHEVAPSGGTFTDKTHEFIRLPRATDVDVDASSHLYATSFKGATFNYAGEDVGCVIRVTPKGYRAEALPDFAALDAAGLVQVMAGPSHRRRLEAQRTLLRRGLQDSAIAALQALAADGQAPLSGRVAALFALEQGQGEQAAPFQEKMMADAALRPLAIRAASDRGRALSRGLQAAMVVALGDASARTRTEAAVALARSQAAGSAGALAELLGDADPTVSHTAVRALMSLKAVEACLAVVDAPGSSDARRGGALRVLQSMHTVPVVEALLGRLASEQDSARRRGLITALCRLSAQDGVWKGDSWGTRPDTTGPYYQAAAWEATERITLALSRALAQASQGEAAFLLGEMSRHKMQDDAALGQVVALALKDVSLVPVALAQLERSGRQSPEALPLLIAAAARPETSPGDRLTAVAVLAKADSPEGALASLRALSLLAKTEEGRKAAAVFLGSPKLENYHTLMEQAALKTDGAEGVWADAALLALASRPSGSPEARQLSQVALDQGWAVPGRRVQILQAIALTRQRAYSERVLSALGDADPAVLAAAQEAAAILKLDPGAVAGPKLATLAVGEVLEAVLAAKGDAAVGGQIFLQAGCVACHTVSKDEPQRGPYLGSIADTYKRRELAEAILDPNKTIAQGFVTNLFEMADGSTQMGFVTTEAADKVVIRNVAAQEISLAVADIRKRDKLPTSLMPPGLLLNYSAKEFASLLDYLQGLAKP